MCVATCRKLIAKTVYSNFSLATRILNTENLPLYIWDPDYCDIHKYDLH